MDNQQNPNSSELETTNALAARRADIRATAGKYLSFALGNGTYGIHIGKVDEIIGIMDITRVPNVPSFVSGVINLRGRVVPVIDLRAKFKMANIEKTDRNCIILVQIKGAETSVSMGLVVDIVSEVIDLEHKNIEPPPTFGSDISTDFILGVGKINDHVLLLLDVDRILAPSETSEVDKMTQSAA